MNTIPALTKNRVLLFSVTMIKIGTANKSICKYEMTQTVIFYSIKNGLMEKQENLEMSVHRPVQKNE